MLLREPHCRGFESGRLRTPAEWVADQGLAPYHAENDRLLDILSLKNRLHPGPLPPQTAADTAVCLYDFDRLRDGLDTDAFAGVAPEAVAAARTDDIALLQLGLERVKWHFERQGPGGAPA